MFGGFGSRVRAARNIGGKLSKLQVRRSHTGSKQTARKAYGVVGAGATVGIFEFFWQNNRYNAELRRSEKSTLSISETPALSHDNSDTALNKAYERLVGIVGAENVSSSLNDRQQHSSSEWSSHRPPAAHVPQLIVYPGNTEEVSAIARTCYDLSIPLTGYSGGTSLEGQFSATRKGITVDFSRMDNIVKLHEKDQDIIVQPGVRWEDLRDYLSDYNLFFPPDPGPGACIGGMIATGCSGTSASKYGTVREWVLSLTVVLADGTVVKTRRRPRKSSAGYDLTKLFIGSEGTLGLVTEAVLKVTHRPEVENVSVACFDSVTQAAETVQEIFAKGITPEAIEFLDDNQMKCINQSKITARTWPELPTLFVKFGGSKSSVQADSAAIQKIAGANGARNFTSAKTADEQQELWSARKEALWSMVALREQPTDRVWTTDVAVPLSALAQIITETKKDLEQSGLKGSIVGHVGDGNFHCFLLFPEEKAKVAEDFVHRMNERAIALEGTVTGEHGVGLVKRSYLADELGIDTVNLMRKLKLSLDRKCILNCDKVVHVDKTPGNHST